MRNGPHCSSTLAMTVSLRDGGDDAAHPVAGGRAPDGADRSRMRELLGDGGELGAVDGAPAGVVGATVEAAGVDHAADGVVADAEEGGGLGDSQMRHGSDSTSASAAPTETPSVRNTPALRATGAEISGASSASSVGCGRGVDEGAGAGV